MVELKRMYNCFLESLARVLKGKAVIIVPLFKTDAGKVNLGFDAMARKYGFEVLSGFPYRYAPKRCKIERLIYVLYPKALKRH